MKRTVIDMERRTEQHLLSGSRFQIDRRLERRGRQIHLDRSYTHHESIGGIRTVLLPDQHLWILFFEGNGRQAPLYCYMHMARIIDEDTVLTVEDLYLDVTVAHDGTWRLLDVDEFRTAIAAGELTASQVQDALAGLENACRLVAEGGTQIEALLASPPARIKNAAP